MSHTKRDYRDLIGGGLLMALGLAAGTYAANKYNIGELGRMGPGMFPIWIGYLLAGLGFFIALPAFFRSGTAVKPDLRPLLFVLAAAGAFALLIDSAGLVPAVFAAVGLSVLADNKLRVKGTLILAAVLSLATWLIFKVGLGMTLSAFAWFE